MLAQPMARRCASLSTQRFARLFVVVLSAHVHLILRPSGLVPCFRTWNNSFCPSRSASALSDRAATLLFFFLVYCKPLPALGHHTARHEFFCHAATSSFRLRFWPHASLSRVARGANAALVHVIGAGFRVTGRCAPAVSLKRAGWMSRSGGARARGGAASREDGARESVCEMVRSGSATTTSVCAPVPRDARRAAAPPLRARRTLLNGRLGAPAKLEAASAQGARRLR
jgi:hypothetical protein